MRNVINESIIRTVADSSPEQAEDLYLALACNAESRGDEEEEAIWLFHAEWRTNWRALQALYNEYKEL